MMNVMNLVKRGSMAALVIAALAACNGGGDKQTAKDTVKAEAPAGAIGTPIKYDSSKRYIFLTWDDSPQPPGTTICKSIFHEAGVKATFFAVGFNQVGPLKKRIIDSLRNAYPEFLLANHSYSHGFRNQYSKFYSTSMHDSALHDFLKNEEMLKIPVKIIRLPGNNTWASNGEIHGQKANNPLIRSLDSLGYKIVGWDMEWHEKGRYPQESATEMFQKLNQKFDDGSTMEQNALVILSHDRLFEKPQYADSLRRFINLLKQDPRNVFETLDHHPMVQRKK